MKENLIEIIYYICRFANSEKIILSKARLVKLIYLIDWKCMLVNGYQMTEIQWVLNHYGPYVEDIIKTLEKYPNFKKSDYINHYGEQCEKIDLVDKEDIQNIQINLSKQHCELIDSVLFTTARLAYTKFLRLIYSTYPIVNSNKMDKLDLQKFAKEYKSSVLDNLQE